MDKIIIELKVFEKRLLLIPMFINQVCKNIPFVLPEKPLHLNPENLPSFSVVHLNDPYK